MQDPPQAVIKTGSPRDEYIVRSLFHQPRSPAPVLFAYLPVPLTMRHVPLRPKPVHFWTLVHSSPSLSLKVHLLLDSPVGAHRPLARCSGRVRSSLSATSSLAFGVQTSTLIPEQLSSAMTGFEIKRQALKTPRQAAMFLVFRITPPGFLFTVCLKLDTQ